MGDSAERTHAVHRLFVKAASKSEGPAPQPSSSSPGQGAPPPPGCPASTSVDLAAAGQTSHGDSVGACPASADARHAARINMPVVPNAAAPHGAELPTSRQASSIPLGAEELPKHQQAEASTSGSGDVWMYPSEQQFYNAMKRKGWDPDARDMSTVVAIHNSVNERAWQQVMLWERLHECECAQPRLRKFQGRPDEYSPKARLLNLLGYKLPFDRHDWVVDRCGRDVRYIIDFYSGAPQPGAPASMYLDVRPALDSVGAAWDRARMQWGWAVSGKWLNS